MSSSEPPLDPEQAPPESLNSHRPNAPTERIDFGDLSIASETQPRDWIDEHATEPFTLIDPEVVREAEEPDSDFPGSFREPSASDEVGPDDWRTVSEPSSPEELLSATATFLNPSPDRLHPTEDEDEGESEDDPLVDRLETLEARLEAVRLEIAGRFDQVRQMFEREVRAESNRERIVDRLHAELQEYKNDLILKITRPIFIDLIQLHDDLGKLIDIELNRSPEPEASEPSPSAAAASERVVKTLRDVMQSLEDTLYRQGVEPFVTEGDRFDPKRQRAVKTVPPPDAERSKMIAARIRPGFASGDRIIRPELVAVYATR